MQTLSLLMPSTTRPPNSSHIHSSTQLLSQGSCVVALGKLFSGVIANLDNDTSCRPGQVRTPYCERISIRFAFEPLAPRSPTQEENGPLPERRSDCAVSQRPSPPAPR